MSKEILRLYMTALIIILFTWWKIYQMFLIENNGYNLQQSSHKRESLMSDDAGAVRRQ